MLKSSCIPTEKSPFWLRSVCAGLVQLIRSRFSERYRYGLPKNAWIAGLFLIVLSVLMFTSSWDDSLTLDEPEHITAGYSYLKTGNGWLNPWHPPLIKDIAAVPLLFAHLRDPFSMKCWQNHQKFAVTQELLFGLGNDPQTMVRLARMPIILMSLLFLIYYYFKINRKYGERVALYSLILVGASPSFIAHSRYVSSDVAAAAAFFICMSSFVEFITMPSLAKFALASGQAGLALLVKASLVVLYPFYMLISLLWVWLNGKIKPHADQSERLGISCLSAMGTVAAMVVVGTIIVMLIYQPHIQNLTPEYQRNYNQYCFKDMPHSLLPRLLKATERVDITRGLSWYLTGVIAQGYHVVYGHDEPSNLFDHYYWGGNRFYYWILLTTKEPIGSLGMICLALYLLAARLIKDRSMSVLAVAHRYFFVVSGTLFAIFYGLIATMGNLNIGFRHILPILPFLYLAVSLVVVRATENWPKIASLKLFPPGLLTITCLSSLLAWPAYLSYYNELAGRTENGYLISIDSNYDWGADLLRLRHYLQDHNVKMVHMFSYCCGIERGYLDQMYEPYFFKEKLPSGELIAIPVSRWRRLVQDGRPDALKVARYPSIEDPAMWQWFCSLQPVGRAGASIMLFRVP
jgi:hypothetical protein